MCENFPFLFLPKTQPPLNFECYSWCRELKRMKWDSSSQSPISIAASKIKVLHSMGGYMFWFDRATPARWGETDLIKVNGQYTKSKFFIWGCQPHYDDHLCCLHYDSFFNGKYNFVFGMWKGCSFCYDSSTIFYWISSIYSIITVWMTKGQQISFTMCISVQ